MNCPKCKSESVAEATAGTYRCNEQTTKVLEATEESSFISAPSGDDLKFKESEFVLFRKLVDWQADSEKSQIILGKPLS